MKEIVDNSTWILFLKAVSAAVTSGLGGLPLFLYDDLGSTSKAIALVIAAGMMSGCSFGLLAESFELSHSLLYVLFYATLGAFIIHYLNRYIESIPGLQIADLKGSQAKRAVVIIVSMAVHSIAEGLSVGISANSEHFKHLDWVVVCSLAAHNIPEGLAISLVLKHQGMNVWQSCTYAVLANLPQPIAAVIAYRYFDLNPAWLSMGFAFSAGIIMLIVIMELIPEALEASQTTGKCERFSLGLMYFISIMFVGYMACHDDGHEMFDH